MGEGEKFVITQNFARRLSSHPRFSSVPSHLYRKHTSVRQLLNTLHAVKLFFHSLHCALSACTAKWGPSSKDYLIFSKGNGCCVVSPTAGGSSGLCMSLTQCRLFEKAKNIYMCQERCKSEHTYSGFKIVISNILKIIHRYLIKSPFSLWSKQHGSGWRAPWLCLNFPGMK